MRSNFDIFVDDWEFLGILGKSAEQHVYRDPNAAIAKARAFAEKLTEVVFELESISLLNIDNQVNKLRVLYSEDVLSEEIVEIFHNIRKTGNKASHDGSYGTTTEAIEIIRLAFYISCWFMEVYISYSFEAPTFIQPLDMDKEKDSKIQELEKKLLLQEEQHEQQAEKIQYYAKQLQNSKGERRKKTRDYVQAHPLDEKQTRRIIDGQLRDAGWEVDSETIRYSKGIRPEKNRMLAIAEWKCGNGSADYALFHGLDLVGIIEAKQFDKDISSDLQQAMNYAREVEQISGMNILQESGRYKVPFIYATNGRPYLKQMAEKSGIWFWDARTSQKPAYALESWHSPEDLKRKLEVDEQQSKEKLETESYPDFAARHYQVKAIKAVEQALEENKRRMLLAMATGTGKTRTALAIMYRLLNTKRVRRILFLVDRNSLGVQTADALKDTKIDNLSFSDIYDVKEVGDMLPENSTKIQISTVQGMVHRLFHQEKDENILTVGMYDFIIVDEAHRGYTEDREMSEEELLFADQADYISQYRRVIDYFDAVILGLTATPALHTSNIFGQPIYTYTYKEAVVDGYLVDHEPPIKFETELTKNGITFVKDEQISFWDDEMKEINKAELEDDLKFDVESFNKKVISDSYNRVILEEVARQIDPHEPEKTLIFAVDNEHADKIVTMLNNIYYENGVEIAEDTILKITGTVKDTNTAIKRFKNEKNPNIVVTVDLLTTGIDVPEICNLVFMRRIRSRILYDQMLGRATRLCPEIGKESFRIFDAVHLYDQLQKVSDMKPVVSQPNLQITDVLEKAIDSISTEGFEFHKTELIAKLQRKKQRLTAEQAEELCELNNIKSLDAWIQEMKNYNQADFQREFENIARLEGIRTQIYQKIISNHTDRLLEVTRGYGEGNKKPEDYLNGFNDFIKENMNLIPALQVVVTRPKDLTREDLRQILVELKKKNYDETALQLAWKTEKNEVIAANIISFIRQAALGSPLIDHETRIKQAMDKVYAMADWTKPQERWLERIGKQLLITPVLGPTAKQAFNDIEIFKQNGGYKNLQRVFGEKIDEVVETINETLYA